MQRRSQFTVRGFVLPADVHHGIQRKSGMTTEAQIAANRVNATKSTGPLTLAGKAVVGLNGMKHGLLSRHGGYSHAAAFAGWKR